MSTIAPTRRTQPTPERRTDGIASHLRAVQPDSAASHLTTARLIEEHLDVAVSMAARYKNRGIDLEDLQQVVVQPHFAELVDQHGRVLHAGLPEGVLQQGGFAASQKAGDDGDR